MSRHRIVRSMNYEDEYYDEEDEYSRSVEDNYCISPSTAAQFTWNREKNVNFASFMNNEEVIDEGDEDAEEEEEENSLSRTNSLSDSANSAKLRLSGIDQARLNSCLDEARNILGESMPESVMVDVIIQNQFNLEASVNELLTQQNAPKPQREPRQRKNRSQDDKDADDLDILMKEIKAEAPSRNHNTSSLKDDPISSLAENIRLAAFFSEGLHKGGEMKKNTTTQLNDVKSSMGTLSNFLKENQKPKLSLSELAQQSKCLKNEDKQDAHPQKCKDSKKPTQLGLSNRTSSSLMQLAKEDQNHRRAGTVSFSLVRLAEQNRKPPLPHKSVLGSTDGGDLGKKMSENLSNLSALVAQHSAQKKVSALPGGGQANVQHKPDNFVCPSSTGSLRTHSSEPGKTSLASLIQASSENKNANVTSAQQGENLGSKLTLTQLAQEHKKSSSGSVKLEAKIGGTGNQQGSVTPNTSLSSKLEELSLDKGVSRLGYGKVKTVPDVSDADKKTSNRSFDLSLASCLKVRKPNKAADKDVFSSLSADLQDTLDLGMPSLTEPWFETEMALTPLQALDANLVCAASTLGFVLCSAKRKRKSDKDCPAPTSTKRVKKYSKFVCSAQVKHKELYKDVVLRDICPFNFGTMSPDDLVGQGQKQAFTRSDKEFTV